MLGVYHKVGNWHKQDHLLGSSDSRVYFAHDLASCADGGAGGNVEVGQAPRTGKKSYEMSRTDSGKAMPCNPVGPEHRDAAPTVLRRLILPGVPAYDTSPTAELIHCSLVEPRRLLPASNEV